MQISQELNDLCQHPKLLYLQFGKLIHIVVSAHSLVHCNDHL